MSGRRGGARLSPGAVVSPSGAMRRVLWRFLPVLLAVGGLLVPALGGSRAGIAPAAAQDPGCRESGGRERPEASPALRRVVCLAPSVAEIACALGRAERLVGTTLYSDFPAEAARLPRIGPYTDPDVERIVALRPDVCLGVSGMTPPSCVARLRGLGVRVEMLDTADLGAVLRSIAAVGELLGAGEQALAATADMRRRMDAVAEAVAGAPYRPTVLYQIGREPLYSAGGGTFLDELIRLAGGRNVCAAMPGYPRLSMEQAVALRPEVILIPTMGRDAFDQAQARWASWPEVPAVASGRLYLLDSDLFDRPGPRLVLGLEEMARLLHPPEYSRREAP